VLDIDGVLADVRHRLHFLDSRPKDWDGFFGAAPDDPPLADGLALAHELAADHDLVYLTGRPERCRADTEAWFAENGLPPGRLFMRSDTDRRPARLTKLEVLRRLSRTKPVACMVDDDARVVQTVRDAGFVVQLAAWMHESPTEHSTLFDAQELQGRT
jgi:hypothetical protein